MVFCHRARTAINNNDIGNGSGIFLKSQSSVIDRRKAPGWEMLCTKSNINAHVYFVPLNSLLSSVISFVPLLFLVTLLLFSHNPLTLACLTYLSLLLKYTCYLPKWHFSLYCDICYEGILLNDRFAHMTITCHGVTFKAHRNIVCTQFEFFDIAHTGGFYVRYICVTVISCLYLQRVRHPSYQSTR